MVKWQTIAGYGSLGVIALIVGLLNLSGMSYSHDGDKFCTECYSEIKVNSTYWEIKAEHAGNKDILFKKLSRSRTLWVNLDKIDKFIVTEPRVKTEILVPATSSTATIKNEYGYLRPLKDGDTLIARWQDRFIVHGSKPANLTVKWSFILDDSLIKSINIDPVWFGLNIEILSKCETTKQIITEQIYDTEIIFNRNTTLCSDFPKNKTCKIISLGNSTNRFSIGSYNVFINTTTCKDTGFKIKEKIIDYDKFNGKCTRNDCIISCDYFQGGNKNGICESGENCWKYDLCTKTEYSRKDTSSLREVEYED